jgi:uncharacterized protein (TIGR00251 family)
MQLTITVIPKSSKNELKQLGKTTFKAKITAAPEKGKANESLIKLLSKYFKIARSNITIKAGATRHKKIIEITP